MSKVSEKKSTKKVSSKQKIEKTQSVKNATTELKEQQLKTREVNSKKGNGKSPNSKKQLPGIKKQYLKSNGSCKVTFTLPREAAQNAHVVTIVGDFNDWNLTDTPMKKAGNGDFKVTLKLTRDREYRFRYLIDNNRWENDWCADKYLPNAFGCDDSLVII